MDEEPVPTERRWAHPLLALGVGLAAVPVLKLLWIPNYVFNFLTTFTHECGHAIFAWLTGRASLPTVSVAGGGVTVWGDPHFAAVLMFDLVPIFFAWKAFRIASKAWCGVFVGVAVLYPIIGWFGVELLPIAGGVLTECLGAAACFYVVFGADLKRPFERHLYSAWGWWMILNRGAESIAMKNDWDSTRVYESGLAAGLTEDLHRAQELLGWAPSTTLNLVLVMCALAMPAGVAAGWAVRRLRAADQS